MRILSFLLPSLTIACAWAAHVDAQEMTIFHIDVGHGAATLILGPIADGRRSSVLIDAGDIPMGGDPDGGAIVNEFLHSHGVSELDYFVVSNYDAHHLGGAVAGEPRTHGTSFVLGPDSRPGTSDDIAVRKFIDRGDSSPPSTTTFRKYQALLRDAELAGQSDRISLVDADDLREFLIELGADATIRVVAGNGNVRGRKTRVPKVDTESERGLCLWLKYGSFDYLVGGDIGGETESEEARVENAVARYLNSRGANLDVLHVGAHGSNSSSGTEFLRMLRPHVAVVSVGNGNPHHDPHLDVLFRLVDSGVYRIYQTEWGATQGRIPANVRSKQAVFQGDVVITTQGTTFQISTTQRFEADAD